MAQRICNKSELVDVVAAELELTKVTAGKAVDCILDSITNALKRGERVQLTGFGSFEVRLRKPRMGRNPQTGETIQIAGGKAPVFKAGKALKDAVK